MAVQRLLATVFTYITWQLYANVALRENNSLHGLYETKLKFLYLEIPNIRSREPLGSAYRLDIISASSKEPYLQSISAA